MRALIPSRAPAFRVRFDIRGTHGIAARRGDVVTLYPEGMCLRRDDGVDDDGGFSTWQVTPLTYEARKRAAIVRANFYAITSQRTGACVRP